MIARALYEMPDNDFVTINKLAAKITVMEYEKGNYVSLTPSQIKKSMQAARVLLEEKSGDQFTIEAKEGDGMNGRKGSHIAFRLYRGKSVKESYLMQQLETRRKHAEGARIKLQQSINIAKLQAGDQSNFFALLEE